jgi:uncharacterized integral membrane protein
MGRFGQIVGVLIIVVVAVFAFANLASMEVNLIFTKITAPLFLLIIVSFLLGMLAQFLFSLIRNSAKKQA